MPLTFLPSPTPLPFLQVCLSALGLIGRGCPRGIAPVLGIVLVHGCQLPMGGLISFFPSSLFVSLYSPLVPRLVAAACRARNRVVPGDGVGILFASVPQIFLRVQWPFVWRTKVLGRRLQYFPLPLQIFCLSWLLTSTGSGWPSPRWLRGVFFSTRYTPPHCLMDRFPHGTSPGLSWWSVPVFH